MTISIFDHPANPNFTTYWHARGYGLFAANLLGRKIFTDGKEPVLNFTLAPNESATFRYRVRITSGNGLPAVTIRDLLKATLRRRPDRIILGEIRAGEALEALRSCR